ncbi:MAG: FkbM family methyltransferase [Eubacteriales bacterium]|nr:FkbM family methyltransferase [Eubacteriales bacterium]
MKSYITDIKLAGKPVALYGMGNGAEKIISYLNYNGIEISCVFASESFVRGQSFMGMKVKTLAQTEEELGDFIIVTAFALEGNDTDIFRRLAGKHTLYAPNLPPYGEGCIDERWYNENKSKADSVRNLLCDDISREIFDSLIEYNITADINRLVGDDSAPESWYDNRGVYIDVGAYDGDTVISYAKKNPYYGEIYAFEPEKTAFRRLRKNTSSLGNVICINSTVWEKDGTISFSGGKGRGSKIAEDGVETPCVSIDSFFKGKNVSGIKIDGEGADMEILKGAADIIYNNTPTLCVAVYHRAYDLFDIPLWLKRQNPSYKFYLRRREYVPAFDVFIYAVKK